MPVKITRTLYYRLAQMLMVTLTILGAGQVAVVTFQWKRLLDEHTQRINFNIAASLVPYVSAALPGETRSYWDLTRLQKQIREFNPSAECYIVDQTGELLLDLSSYSGSSRQPINLEPVRKFLQDGAENRLPIYGQDPRSSRRNIVFSAAAIEIHGRPAYLYIGLDTWRSRALFEVLGRNSVIGISVALFILTFAVTAVFGLFAFFILTRRFAGVTAVIGEFAKRDFSRRAPVGRDDEIGMLASTANQMADTIVAGFSELEHRDQLRRELVANVSHDLRGPVGVISGCAEQLADTLAREPNENLSVQLSTLQHSVKSLSRLLLELFELSKLEARETKISAEKFSPEQLLTDICASHTGQAQEYGVRLEVAGDAETPLVIGDIALLERALGNLVDNALRHTPAGGIVSLGIKNQYNSVRVSVTDTGVGIESKDVPFIFDRFYTGTPAQPARGTSTGLGLAIVKRIIEAHESEISVASEPGKGTEFSFYLRTADAAAKHPADGS